MVVIPISIERTNPKTVKVVEWRLSNVCNFNCSFCEPEFKDGSKRFADYDTYIRNIDHLMQQGQVLFQFTGGEPTLYPKLMDLLTYIKTKGGYTSMISNGSRTLRWWKEFAELKVLDRLYLSYHPEQDPTPDHIIEVNQLMQQSAGLVSVFVTAQCEPALFNKAVTAQEEILSKATTISSLRPISNGETLQPYTAEQLEILQKNLYVRSNDWYKQPKDKFAKIMALPQFQIEVEMKYSNGTSKVGSANYFIESKQNNFKGWECDIGKDLLIIEVDRVYRGVCREGGTVSEVLDNFTWADNSVICNKDFCNCALDLQEPKRKLDD